MNYKFKANEMTKEQIIKRVNELTDSTQMQFSCFHDGMLVYEYSLDETETDWDYSNCMLEFTFFPKDSAVLTHYEHIEDILEQADLTKWHSLDVVGSVDGVDISDALN